MSWDRVGRKYHRKHPSAFEIPLGHTICAWSVKRTWKQYSLNGVTRKRRWVRQKNSNARCDKVVV